MSDAQVPVENLIGNVGDGAKIAFNILNVGRFKLGASVTGGAKLALHDSIRYANERHQFNKPISSFGAMKHKLAEMAIRTWVAESITYRTVGMIDALIGDGADNQKNCNQSRNTRLNLQSIKSPVPKRLITSLTKWCRFTGVTVIRRIIRRKKRIVTHVSIAFSKARTKLIEC
ncbi:MAG: acyl-CoA dehydrogenase family protein [Pyrinomonadaceae bacterium]